MGTSDWLAAAAAVISLLALLFSLRNRSADIAREEEYRVRSRAWEILNSKTGLRTILALHKDDGLVATRVDLLERTADQLEVAGAAKLASELRDLLKHTWGADTIAQSQAARNTFIESASHFMKPASQRLHGRQHKLARRQADSREITHQA